MISRMHRRWLMTAGPEIGGSLAAVGSPMLEARL
jgi:hypothetical protein